MHIHARFHRLAQFALTGERRLCFDVEQATFQASQWVQRELGQPIVQGVEGLMKGLHKAWGDKKTLQEAEKEALFLTLEFGKNAPPQVKRVVDKYGSERGSLTPKQIRDLTDMEKWQRAMRDPKAYDELVGDPKNQNEAKLKSGTELPQSLFLSLTVEERQSIFLDTVDTYIPKAVQQKADYKDKFGVDAKGEPVIDRFHAMKEDKKSYDEVLSAVGGVLGSNTAFLQDAPPGDPTKPPKDKDMAKDALKAFYPEADAPTAKTSTNQLKSKLRLGSDLVTDYQNALRYVGPGVAPGTNTFPLALQRHVPSGRFRGALNLGVVGKSELEGLGGHVLEDTQRLYTREVARQSRELEERRGVSTREIEKRATSLADIWESFGATTQLALVGGLIYGAYRSWHIRWGAIGLFLAIVGRKAIYGKGLEDPLHFFDSGINNLNGINDRVKDKVPGFKGRETAKKEAEVYAKFLSPVANEKLGVQMQGLMLLSDVPTDVIARNTVFDGDKIGLNFNRNGAVMKWMAQKAKEDGMDNKVFDYFENEHNQNQLNIALNYIYFGVAKRENPGDPRIRTVQQAMGRLPHGSPVTMLKNENARAWQLYMDLAAEGCNTLKDNNTAFSDPLGVLIHTMTPKDFAADAGVIQERADERRGDVIGGLKLAGTNVMGAGGTFDVALKGDKYEFKTKTPYGREFTHELPASEVEVKNASEVLKMWKREMLKTYVSQMDTPGGTKYATEIIDEINIKLFSTTGPAGGAGRGPDAKMPFADVVAKEPAQLKEVYERWRLKPTRLSDNPVREVVLENINKVEEFGAMTGLKIEEKDGKWIMKADVGREEFTYNEAVPAAIGKINGGPEIYSEWQKAVLEHVMKPKMDGAGIAKYKVELQPDGKVQYYYATKTDGTAVDPATMPAADKAVTDFNLFVSKTGRESAALYNTWYGPPRRPGMDAYR